MFASVSRFWSNMQRCSRVFVSCLSLVEIFSVLHHCRDAVG